MWATLRRSPKMLILLGRGRRREGESGPSPRKFASRGEIHYLDRSHFHAANAEALAIARHFRGARARGLPSRATPWHNRIKTRSKRSACLRSFAMAQAAGLKKLREWLHDELTASASAFQRRCCHRAGLDAARNRCAARRRAASKQAGGIRRDRQPHPSEILGYSMRYAASAMPSPMGDKLCQPSYRRQRHVIHRIFADEMAASDGVALANEQGGRSAEIWPLIYDVTESLRQPAEI